MTRQGLALVLLLAAPARAEPVPQVAWQPALVALTVRDLGTSVDWYRDNLSFAVVERNRYPDHGLEIAFLARDGVYLELIDFDAGLDAADLLPEGAERLHGFLKVGFRVADLDALQATMDENGAEFVVRISPLPKGPELPADWPERYLLVKDPDGHFVQCFSGAGGDGAAPLRLFLAMLDVADLDASVRWYREWLGFTELDRVGEPGNQRALLDNGGFYLEIGQLAGGVPWRQAKLPEGARRDRVRGIKKLALRSAGPIDGLFRELERQGVEVLVPPRASTQEWAEEYFIVEDPDGAYLQVIR